MSKKVKADSFVLYRSRCGKCWHREPECATSPEVAPQLDGAHRLFDELEMARFGELDDPNLCGNCAESRPELNAEQTQP